MLAHLLLERADQVEVVVRDVVVVVLDLAKGLLVLLHELVDVVILALLDLEDLHLWAQGCFGLLRVTQAYLGLLGVGAGLRVGARLRVGAGNK